jgi:OTT_1508-like deaminase
MQNCHSRVRRYVVSLSGLVREGQANLMHHGGCLLYNPSAAHRESKEDIERLGEYCADTHSEYVKLCQKRWAAITTLAHQTVTTQDRQAAKSLTDLAYQVRQSTSFRNLLTSVFQHQQTRVTKIVEQIGKISRFYRCALTIVQVAAKFCKDVSYVCVKTLGLPKRAISLLSTRRPVDLANRLPVALRPRLQSQTDMANRFLRRWRQYVVHAEMQLLLFYETHADIRLVLKYIGLSKRSCYLCAAFIRFHGHFVMEGAHQQLYSLWTIPLQIAFHSGPREDNFKRALSSLCDDVRAKVNAISVHKCYQFPWHVESVANFSRASLLSNGTPAEAYDLGAAAFLTTSQRSVTLGEEEPPLAFDTLLRAGASVEGQRTMASCSRSKAYLGTSATLIGKAATSDNEIVADSLPHGIGAAPERSKEVPKGGIHSQENIRRKRRRRRRRSNTRDTVLAPNRRYRQSNRNRAQYREKHRRCHNIRSNLAQNRKRTFGGGIIITAPRVRKGTKTSSKRNTRGVQSRLGDGVRHGSTWTKSDGDFDISEVSCVYVIEICIKTVVDFFRGVLTR